jgi:hypothetical protein
VSPHPEVEAFLAGRRASPPGLAAVCVYKARIFRRFNYLHFSLSFLILPIPDRSSIFSSPRPSLQSNLSSLTFISFSLSYFFLLKLSSVRPLFFNPIIYVFRFLYRYFSISARSRYIFNNRNTICS